MEILVVACSSRVMASLPCQILTFVGACLSSLWWGPVEQEITNHHIPNFHCCCQSVRMAVALYVVLRLNRLLLLKLQVSCSALLHLCCQVVLIGVWLRLWKKEAYWDQGYCSLVSYPGSKVLPVITLGQRMFWEVSSWLLNPTFRHTASSKPGCIRSASCLLFLLMFSS